MKQVLTSMWFNWARPAGGFYTVAKTLKIRSTQSKVAPAKKEIPITRAKKRAAVDIDNEVIGEKVDDEPIDKTTVDKSISRGTTTPCFIKLMMNELLEIMDKGKAFKGSISSWTMSLFINLSHSNEKNRKKRSSASFPPFLLTCTQSDRAILGYSEGENKA